jgi:hypothetical protein
MKHCLATVLEILFFAASLFLLVPLNISRSSGDLLLAGTATMELVVGGALFVCYLVLTFLRHADTLVTAAMKLLSYLGVAWWLYGNILLKG